MALSFDHGAIQWLAADAATNTYVVNTMSFQPKALRFYWQGLKDTADALSSSTSERRGIGFATSTSDRRCVGTFNSAGSAAASCGSMARNDSVVCTCDGTGTITGLLDLTAVASDGFTLTINDQGAVDLTVFWEAWGGTDITVAACVDIAEPAGTGTQNYTVTGFDSAGGGDQVVMFAGVQSTAALNTGFDESSTLSVGFCATAGAANSICVLGSSDDGSLNMDTDGGCYTGMCIASIALAGGAVNDARAYLSAYGTNLFTLQWDERAITNRRRIALAIKGGRWATGSYTIDGTTGSATATVSSLTFVPVGLSLIGRMTAEQADDAATANDRMSLGTGTSTSSRRSMGMLDEDGTAAVEVDHTIQYDQVLCFPSATGTLLAAYDINAMNSDGFQIIVDVADAGADATQWQGYLTFGDAPAVMTTEYVAPVVQHGSAGGVMIGRRYV